MSTTQPSAPWSGIFSAVTTKMNADASVDFKALERHFAWQIESGVHGLVVLGSLGENGALTAEEKASVLTTAVGASGGRIPVLTGVAETSTRLACEFAANAARIGADGLMVLPGMQYVSDRRETLRHFRSVAQATDLPIMLYNNPVAYRVDVTPEMFAELADEPKFVALKESSDDVRRITEIRRLTGKRYAIFTGVDDLALGSFLVGAVGWVAGLVCAFPKETVALYELMKRGRTQEALTLFEWFTPLLHLDVSVKFVQNIKLAEAIVGCGTEHVRAPRLALAGDERAEVEKIVRTALSNRPPLPKF